MWVVLPLSALFRLKPEFSELVNKYCKRKHYALKSGRRTRVPGINERQVPNMTKEQYIQRIIDLMNRCNDLPLLDLILRLLRKSL